MKRLNKLYESRAIVIQSIHSLAARLDSMELNKKDADLVMPLVKSLCHDMNLLQKRLENMIYDSKLGGK